MADRDARPPFLRLESWARLNDPERQALMKLIADAGRSRRDLDRYQREINGLRDVAKRMDARVRSLSERLQAAQVQARSRADDPDTSEEDKAVLTMAAQSLRELQTFSDELLDEIEVEAVDTPVSAVPRKRRPRRVSIEALDAERARIHMVTEVTLVTRDGKSYTGFSENISAGGVFVAMWDPPSIGTAARMDLTVPGIGHLSVDSVVRWHRTASNHRKTGCGVAFGPDEREVTSKVEELVMSRWEPTGRTTVQVEDIP